MVRLCMILAFGAVTGVALASVAAAAVLTFGPESLLDFGEATYGIDGKYVPR